MSQPEGRLKGLGPDAGVQLAGIDSDCSLVGNRLFGGSRELKVKCAQRVSPGLSAPALDPFAHFRRSRRTQGFSVNRNDGHAH